MSDELLSLRALASKGYDVVEAIAKAESKLVVLQPPFPQNKPTLLQAAREQSDVVQGALRFLEKAEFFLQKARGNTSKFKEQLAAAEVDEQGAVAAVNGARQR